MKDILMKILSGIARSIAKLNLRYDKMKEPGRFYTMLVIAFVPWIFLDIFAIITSHKGFDIFEMIWIMFLIVLRLWWIEGNLKKFLDDNQG